jgi:hypothetical protein
MYPDSPLPPPTFEKEDLMNTQKQSKVTHVITTAIYNIPITKNNVMNVIVNVQHTKQQQQTYLEEYGPIPPEQLIMNL